MSRSLNNLARKVNQWARVLVLVFTVFHYLTGFNEGWIFFDDADRKKANAYWGTLPDGEYGKDTKIFYYCRSDGFATNAIYLPTNSPFVLLQRGLQCQYVHGMYVQYEFFKWDLADKNTRYQSSGSTPRVKLTDPPFVFPMMVKGKDLKLNSLLLLPQKII